MQQEALETLTALFTIDLHPSRLHDVPAGVKEQLNAQLLKYSDDFDGVVISYSNERILKRDPFVGTYFPYFRVEVQARVLVFKPTPRSLLTGKVIKVGSDYIGLLVLDVFNAAIGRDSIRKEFNMEGTSDAWVSRKHPEHRLAVGSSVKFTVESVQDQAGFFSIVGSLQDHCTGEVEYLARHAPHNSKKSSKKAKHKKQHEGNGVEAASSEKLHKKEKKKRKHKQDQDSSAEKRKAKKSKLHD